MNAAANVIAPVIETMPDRRIVGLLRRYNPETRASIPQQWAAYDAGSAALSDAVPDAWYGVCANFGADDSFDYLTGMELPEGPVPEGWSALVLPAGRWARFATRAHISAMGDIWMEICRDWLGKDGIVPREGPSTEFYPPEFDGRTGEGGYEIWFPIN